MKLRKSTKQKLRITFTVLLVFVMVLPVCINFIPQNDPEVDPSLLNEMQLAMEQTDKKNEQPDKNIEGTYQVTDFVSGNCFTILYGQERRDVKLIGIKDGSCTADDLQNYIADDMLELAFDEQHENEKGELLAYAFRADGTFINKELLAMGLAELSIEKTNTTYAEDFRLAQEAAQGKGLGIWAEK